MACPGGGETPTPGLAFTICATFDSGYTSVAETTINSAIQQFETQFHNPMTVYINFASATPGGGEIPAGDIGWNSTNNYVISYQQFINALDVDTYRPYDVTALLSSNLANGTTIPNSGGVTNMLIHSANAEALGISLAGVVSSASNPDGTVYLDLPVMNLSRSNTPTNAQYDLETISMHEIDEVLGLSSTLDQGLPAPYNTYYSPLDLFRYNSSGQRSMSTSSSAWFEITPGTKVQQFNSASGLSYGEWKNTSGHVQVQDVTATAGTADEVNLGPNEIEALDAIGYDTLPTATPEPSTWLLFGAGIAACGLWRKLRA
jgi:hypothetical protein